MITHVWTIGGFLGAGKTTLLMRLAGALAARHPKGLAIIANDVSQIGVDQRVLREVYPAVYELFDGCVCCQLSADLVQTIERIQSEINPAVILIEPSGIAEPAKIKDTLRRYAKHLGMVRTLVVIDATKFDELMETLEPLITAQIIAGDVLAINKVDIAAADDVARVRHAVAQLNPEASVLEISAIIPGDVIRVMDEMMSFEGPTTNAGEINLIAENPNSAEQWEKIIASLVAQIAAEAVGSGATVIGHIKVFAAGTGGLRVYCSSTGTERSPSVSRIHENTARSSDDDSRVLTLNLNAIVYGLNSRGLSRCVAQALLTTREQWKLRTETVEPPDHEHNHSVH